MCSSDLLISVAMLEDKGYEVVFREGKVFLRHKATGQVKKVGIREKNLYIFEVDGMSTELPIVGEWEKDMQLKLEREQVLHAGEKDMQLELERERVLHAGDSEPQDVEQPQEDHGVEETTHAEKFHARRAEGVHAAIPLGMRWGDMHE